MSELILFELSAEVKIPMEQKIDPKSKSPKYEPINPPKSIPTLSDSIDTLMGKQIVGIIKIKSKTIDAKYFPKTTFQTGIAFVNNISAVPLLNSSEKSFIHIVGIKMINRNGERKKNPSIFEYSKLKILVLAWFIHQRKILFKSKKTDKIITALKLPK